MLTLLDPGLLLKNPWSRCLSNSTRQARTQYPFFLSACHSNLQHVLCYTTLLDADLKNTTDTTFTVLLAKVGLEGGRGGGEGD